MTVGISETQPSEDHHSYLDDDFKGWVETLLEQNHVPGFSVAVIDGGRVESAGYGFARLPAVHATADTVYCMASTTKAFTAALIGMLIENDTADKTKCQKQKLRWTTPVTEILHDDFVTTEDYITKHVTIEDALSHRTGILSHDLLWGPTMGTASSITRSLRHLGPLVMPFRAKFHYNNLMYGVVGNSIEKLSGKPFAEMLRDRILRPLNMRNTYLGVKAASQALTQDQKLSFARGYYWVDDDANSSCSSGAEATRGHYVPEAFIDIGGIGPAGDNMSSVNDYAKWVTRLLAASKSTTESKDRSDDGKTSSQPSTSLISHALFLELTTPRSLNLPVKLFFPEVIPVPPNPSITPLLYALGWQINPFIAPGEQVLEHSGGLPGFGAHVFLVPNHDFGVVAVGNTSMTANKICETVGRDLIGRKLGKGKQERRPKDPEKKETSKDPQIAAQVDTKDAAAPSTLKNPPATDKHFDDMAAGIDGHYEHAAYGTFVISRAKASAALDAEKPQIGGSKIERKQKYEVKGSGGKSTPLAVLPIPRRGLHYQLVMHTPRKAAAEQTMIIYDLEMLMCRGDLSDDPFKNLEQEFPEDGSGKLPLQKHMIWQSQKLDKKGAVAELDDRGQVQKLGLQLMRIDVPEETNGDPGYDELEDGWADRLVWFHKARAL